MTQGKRFGDSHPKNHVCQWYVSGYAGHTINENQGFGKTNVSN